MHWIIPHKYRWMLLLVASYFFYMSWEPTYILLIVFSTTVDYFLSRYFISSENRLKAKRGLILTVMMNLGLLFAFKYYDFFQSILQWIIERFGGSYTWRKSSFLLPVGISFYTFQTLSYSIDVYRKKIQPEKHFGKFALFVSFFPQLVAGPIERAGSLIPQLSNDRKFISSEKISHGAQLIVWGLFKKVVVADNLTVLVDHIYDHPQFQNGGALAFATILFTIHIYADFSGYTDIALGAAKLLGIELSENFKTPYFSQSINEFWKRWHITLSQWLRDYVYIPLGGNRKGKSRELINLFITFFLAGLWHGASITFAVWGLLHATLVVIEKVFKIDQPSQKKLFKLFRIGLNFLLIALTMIPVRAENIDQMNLVFSALFDFHWSDFYLAVAENKWTVGVIGAALLMFTDVLLPKGILRINYYPSWIKYSWLMVILLFIFLSGDVHSDAFFYFQF